MPPQLVETQRTRLKQRLRPADSRSVERDVRQLLADKISGNQVGIWLLVPEHLRLGTWDLLRGGSGRPGEAVEPRLALHLVNEAAMCRCSYRHQRSVSQKGFELANGLPFVPTDAAIHELLASHTVGESRLLQIALGKLRRADRHFGGRLLALDPHRMTSYTKRQMRRHRFSSGEKPAKMGQASFLLDCATGQPVCFTLASSAASVSEATPNGGDWKENELKLESLWSVRRHGLFGVFVVCASSPCVDVDATNQTLFEPDRDWKRRNRILEKLDRTNAALAYQAQSSGIGTITQLVIDCSSGFLSITTNSTVLSAATKYVVISIPFDQTTPSKSVLWVSSRTVRTFLKSRVLMTSPTILCLRGNPRIANNAFPSTVFFRSKFPGGSVNVADKQVPNKRTTDKKIGVYRFNCIWLVI